ncbi:MAG: hypothetical protein J6U43_06145 [Bacteroidales bacterium]|nr:hypothetical protein [Bacteroidales bacterium]
MNKTEKNLPKGSQSSTSRERLARRIVEHYPGRVFECEDDVYDALDEYASFLSEHYEKMLGDHNRLTGLMCSNPRVGAFITDVADGEDALVACVRYFGKELLESSSDAQKQHAIKRANEEYLERHRAFQDMEAAMHRNVEKSTRSIERFMCNKKMDESELDNFLDRVFHVCHHVFAGDLSEDVLELLYKGLRYDTDLSCAEHVAEVKGRNKRIVMERRDSTSDSLSDIHNAPSDEKSSKGYRRTRRRPSVWDL